MKDEHDEPHFLHHHNRTRCRFLGHHLGHDVYYYESPKDNKDKTLGRTYVARFGDGYGDFAVYPLDVVASAETFNHVVQTDLTDSESDIGSLAIAVTLAVNEAQKILSGPLEDVQPCNRDLSENLKRIAQAAKQIESLTLEMAKAEWL